MCDDLGYGDTGFNGNDVIVTPHLDRLREEGGAFRRFYAGGPVCSPTRATCLTGRHYSRYGITHANRGRLPTQEITIAEVCRSEGYATGHFGKWHLGTLTTTERDNNRGMPGNVEDYSPPWVHGFDVCFSTEAMVPTWDPSITPDEMRGDRYRWGEPGTAFGTAYWNERGEKLADGLGGDDSKVIVDRAEPFIREAVGEGKPFLSLVWFHAPHDPVVAGPEYLDMYRACSAEEAHYYGCITAMDEQIGRINQLVKDLGIEHNTMIWFCSDNEPEGGDVLEHNARNRGVTGGLRGRKRSLFEGGIGVPALVKWPGVVRPGSEYAMPCSTLDYFPTIVEVLGFEMPDGRPIDGISLLPLLEDRVTDRQEPIPYRFVATEESMFGSPTLALTDGRWKLVTNLSEDGDEEMLFDLEVDRGEEVNLISSPLERVRAMREQLSGFVESWRASHHGGDYDEDTLRLTQFGESSLNEVAEFTVVQRLSAVIFHDRANETNGSRVGGSHHSADRTKESMAMKTLQSASVCTNGPILSRPQSEGMVGWTPAM